MADAIEAVDDAVVTKIDTTKPTTEIKADGVEDEVPSLHVGNLTRFLYFRVLNVIIIAFNKSATDRNVKSNHIEEIFGCYGTVTNVDLQIDTRTGVSKGFAYVTFEKSKDAEQAVLYLDGGQLDGNEIKVSFVLVSKRRKDSPGTKRSAYYFRFIFTIVSICFRSGWGAWIHCKTHWTRPPWK